MSAGARVSFAIAARTSGGIARADDIASSLKDEREVGGEADESLVDPEDCFEIDRWRDGGRREISHRNK
jgi:hypothetical protein